MTEQDKAELEAPWPMPEYVSVLRNEYASLRSRADAVPMLVDALKNLAEALGLTLTLARVKFGNLDPDANVIFQLADAAIAQATPLLADSEKPFGLPSDIAQNNVIRATDSVPEGDTPAEILASRLIDAWCEAHGKQMPWAKAIEITAIITKMPDHERDRLLAMDEEKA